MAVAERKLRNTIEGGNATSPAKSIIYSVKRDSAFDKNQKNKTLRQELSALGRNIDHNERSVSNLMLKHNSPIKT